MTTPAVPPARNPGETITAYMTRLDEWSKEQAAPGATTSAKPGPNNEKPAGTEVSPGRIVSPNGLTTYMYTPGAGWAASPYPPGAADKAAAGIGAGGKAGSTTSPINYQALGVANKDALQTAAGGLKDVSAHAYVLPGGTRAVDRSGLTVWSKDPATGNWTNAGFPPNAQDKLAARGIAAGESRQTASLTMAGGNPQSTLPPEARPFAGQGGLNLGGVLETRAGPAIPGWDAYRQPGIGIPTGNNQTINGVERGLNTMTAGRQGSSTALQFPVAPGFRREGDVGNSINFAAGNTSPGTLEPQMLFPSMSVTPQTATPGTYQYGLGNVGDSNRAYSVPFNIGPGGAALANVAGNNVQVNSADRGTGYGFALNAMPSSSVFAATGRNPSEDPASQTAQVLALNSALQQFGGGPGALTMLNAANGNQFGGNHAGTQNGPFSGNGGSGQGTFWQDYAAQLAAEQGAGNYGGGSTTGGPGFGPDGPQYYAAGGRIATLPLGSRFASFANGTGGPKSMVTNGPKLLIDARTGNVDAVMGEDNADPGFAPNKERLTFSGLNNSMLNIKPLQPFATGGNISTLNPDNSGTVNPDIPTTGGPAGLTGGDLSGINLNGGSLTNAPPPPPDPNAPPPDVTPSPVVPPSAPPPPPVEPYAGTPFIPDPNLLMPWQAAAQKLQMDNAARDAYRYRFTNAGLSGPKAIDVLQGDVPNQELAPGLFYDPSGQVNKVISDIIGTQTRQQELGAQEDINPIQQRATYLGNALDDLKRIRDLEISKAAADTGTGLDAQGNDDATIALQAAQDGLQRLMAAGGATPQQILAQQQLIDRLTAQVNAGSGFSTYTSSSSSAGQAAKLQAEIDALKARLPAGANESDLNTELALLRDRIAKNQSRLDLSQQVANLGKLGVPRLNAPVLQRTV